MTGPDLAGNLSSYRSPRSRDPYPFSLNPLSCRRGFQLDGIPGQQILKFDFLDPVQMQLAGHKMVYGRDGSHLEFQPAALLDDGAGGLGIPVGRGKDQFI